MSFVFDIGRFILCLADHNLFQTNFMAGEHITILEYPLYSLDLVCCVSTPLPKVKSIHKGINIA